MIRSRDMNFYGSGVIKNTMAPDLDSREPLINQREVHKDAIHIRDNIKVHPTMGKNYYKDYMNDSVDNLNYNERESIQINDSVQYLEALPNEDYDFDGDGQTDFEYSSGELEGIQANHSEEAGEKIEKGEEIIEEKSTKEIPKHEIIKDVKANNELMDEEKNINGNKDLRLNNIDARTDDSIKLSDMITIGSGSLALAMMLMGKSI